MEKVRGNFHNIYYREEPHPPGLPLATHFDSEKANNEIPLEVEVEVEEEVQHLPPHRADGHTHLHKDHFKQWQWEAYPGEQAKTPHGRSYGCSW